MIGYGMYVYTIYLDACPLRGPLSQFPFRSGVFGLLVTALRGF